ncbi:MAG: DUF4037 domain-containing protein [Anaerolineae bacterium]|nr:DUF4037 domain-containing protein [Anaerolineae bacterium]
MTMEGNRPIADEACFMTDDSLRGLALSRAFYDEAVRPVIDSRFPDLQYAAALLGPGSEVLGFDDAMSTDHHWGPRLHLFLSADDHAQSAELLHTTLAEALPHTFRGYSTHWTPPDPEDSGTQHPVFIEGGPVNHRVEIDTWRSFVRNYLGFDVAHALAAADWLTFPEQRLRTLTGGAVYRDDIGLQTLRDRFSYYPHDVWLYQMASVWARIGQEEHLMGRAGLIGDEIGSALLGARLVRDVMRLCFLMEKTYAPYPKWFGTAFRLLTCAAALVEPLQEALAARTWQERESHLVVAWEVIGRMHNALTITDALPTTPTLFHGRPFRVIAQHGYAEAIAQQIDDPEVRCIADRMVIGGIDVFSDNTDLLENMAIRPKLRTIFT